MVQENKTSPLHYRLGRLDLLGDGDEALLNDLLRDRRRYSGGTLLQPEKSEFRTTRVVLEGWGIRFKTLPDGSRQIVNFLLPGDTIGLYGALFSHCEVGVEMLTDANLAETPCVRIIDTFRKSARLGASLCWIGGQDEQMLEQQIVRIGRMNALQRIAHLFLELHHRLRMSGRNEEQSCVLPVTQHHIADALGMTHVHANRSCRKLRDAGLLRVVNGSIRLHDPAALYRFCHFDDGYIDAEGVPVDARKRL